MCFSDRRADLLGLWQPNIKLPLDTVLALKDNNIFRPRRGKRAGARKQRKIETLIRSRDRRRLGAKAANVSNLVSLPCAIDVHIGHRPRPHTSHAVPALSLHNLHSTTASNLIQAPLSRYVPPSQCVNLTLMNARSVANKAHRISEYITDNEVDILAITETWLREGDSSIVDDLCPPSHKFFGIPRPAAKGNKGGGVGFVIRSDIDTEVQSSGKYKTFESLSVLIKAKRPLHVCVIYRPPPSQKNGFTLAQFISDIEEFFSHMCTSVVGDLCVVGDFNLHCDTPSDPTVARFFEVLDTSGLKQWVQSPTHRGGHLLDLVISRSDEHHPLFTSVTVSDNNISDHCAVVCSLVLVPAPPTRRQTTGRAIKRVNTEALANDLSQSLPTTLTHTDTNSIAATYVTVTREVTDKHAPLRKITIKGDSNKPWYNDDIHTARIERRRLERQYKKSGLSVHKQMWDDQSHKVIHLIKQCKSSFYQHKFISADSKETFALVNGLMSCSNGPSLPTASSDQSLADTFVQFFSQKVSNIRDALDQAQLTESINTKPNTPPPALCGFELQNPEDIVRYIKKCPTKTCALDSIPTVLLKDDHVLQVMQPTLTSLINQSLTDGVFPQCLKEARIKPLLKKQGLDVNDFKSYRPVSNIPFLSKVMERVVSHQLTKQLTQYNIHDSLQSAYKKGTSTETALLRIKADIDRVLDEGDGVLLVLLDLSAAFDTIDHTILLQRLQDYVGLCDTALKWVQSYLTNRTQAVCINQSVSKPVDLTIGVPQGSVLGPLLFLVYILPLQQVIERFRVWRHGFADDTQAYNRLTLKNKAECAGQVKDMEQCLSEIRRWMCQNKLKLNESKTEVIVIASRHNIKLANNISVQIGEEQVHPKPVVRNLGGTFDQVLSMEQHVSTVARNAYYHLRRIAKIRSHLTQDACAAVINATVTSRLDFHNGLLLGVPDKTLRKLQLVQNSAARLLTGTRKREHITPVLQSLHWLPISHRVQFKVLVTIHKALHSDTAPSYISELCVLHKPSRQLRSSTDHWRLHVPKASNQYGSRSLQVRGAQLWNNLPAEMRALSSQTVFRKRLKTVLFKDVY